MDCYLSNVTSSHKMHNAARYRIASLLTTVYQFKLKIWEMGKRPNAFNWKLLFLRGHYENVNQEWRTVIWGKNITRCIYTQDTVLLKSTKQINSSCWSLMSNLHHEPVYMSSGGKHFNKEINFSFKLYRFYRWYRKVT